MSHSECDIQFMQRALQLAALGGVGVAPNPMVGAVIVHNDRIIGEGYHKIYGGPHAEVNAVNSVKDPELLPEATIYVTLEPCSHFGKTPPCADLIIEKQFKRVVVACIDPFAKVAGSGIKRIKAAGIEVTVGILEEEAKWLNRRFFTFHKAKRPYIFLKWAASADGFLDQEIKDSKREIQWITPPIAKTYVHRWRASEQAILVGWKTVQNDNPKLNVRKVTGRNPHRFIIDPQCKASVNSTVFQDGAPTTVFVEENTYKNMPESVTVVCLSTYNLENMLAYLYEKNILSIFVEGGGFTLNAFISQNLWDEAFVFSGNVIFKNGTKAPTINGVNIEHKEIGDSQLNHILNS